MDLTTVDTCATRGTSLLHRAAPGAKLVAAIGVLIAVIASTNVLVIFGITLTLAGVVLAFRLPWRAVFVLALYPGMFAALFAFAAGARWLAAALIIVKAVTAALSVIMLMFTTPYPQVFAPLQRVMPAVIGDALFMTYRSLFLLLEKFTHTLTAARLRAGITGVQPLRSAATMTRSLGGVLLYSIDLSQRTHDIMYLRGYDGRLAVTTQPSVSRVLDGSVIVFGSLLALVGVVWRLWWPAFGPYSWLPLVAGFLALLAGAALSLLPRKERQ
jgi:cobalt/nickel transport system permease protein